jgi:hypothetical protein
VHERVAPCRHEGGERIADFFHVLRRAAHLHARLAHQHAIPRRDAVDDAVLARLAGDLAHRARLVEAERLEAPADLLLAPLHEAAQLARREVAVAILAELEVRDRGIDRLAADALDVDVHRRACVRRERAGGEDESATERGQRSGRTGHLTDLTRPARAVQ